MKLRALFPLMAVLVATAPARAQEKAPTCVVVEAPAGEAESLERLVRSEVDRHPSHRAAKGDCAVHLKVELIVVEGDRFLTGRVGGEVPQRVHVEGPGGKALESAVDELLRVVLGNDPVALKAPGGQSWFSDRLFSVKDRGRNTFDAALFESASPVVGHVTFAPGLALGFSRELEKWQVGIEALWAQSFTPHPGRADLDSLVRLQAALTLFTSSEADVSAFFGLSLGVGHERFSGPRAKDLVGGDGAYQATGPALGLRAGVELFRTTSTRAFAEAEAFIPIFWANDQEAEIVSGWVPGFSLGSGVRF